MKLFPIYKEGEFAVEVDDTENTITFHLDYIPQNWDTSIYEQPYRIENDTLIWGEKFSNPDDSTGTEWFFKRL